MASNNKKFYAQNPSFDTLGYVIAVANLKDKHDPSAPSDYHWKILKCRMIIFSNSSILASPDMQDVKQVHIIFNKIGDDYDKLNSLFLKFSLIQQGDIGETTAEMFNLCFVYTMRAKLAPEWNTLGNCYLINNKNFLTASDPQDGLRYHISSNERETVFDLKPIKIRMRKSSKDCEPGEWVRVLPSLNKAIFEDSFDSLSGRESFGSYKVMRRHWKNIHGYRLPVDEAGCSYCGIRFWRGDPLTYPKICVVRDFPIMTPVPKNCEISILSNFSSCLKYKMPTFLGKPLHLNQLINCDEQPLNTNSAMLSETQAISLCTPTQSYSRNNR